MCGFLAFFLCLISIDLFFSIVLRSSDSAVGLFFFVGSLGFNFQLFLFFWESSRALNNDGTMGEKLRWLCVDGRQCLERFFERLACVSWCLIIVWMMFRQFQWGILVCTSQSLILYRKCQYIGRVQIIPTTLVPFHDSKCHLIGEK